MIKTQFVLAILALLGSLTAVADIDFKEVFKDRDACFLMTDIKNGKIVAEYNSKRCAERLSPCSTFKIAASLMAFDHGILKNETQVIKWDGVKRDRPELNQDQTPITWMSQSVKWVTEWVMPQLGDKSIHHYLDAFDYGNKDFSGGLKDAWVTSSLKISADEQVRFLSRFWKNELPIAKQATDLTKKIIFVKKLGKGSELYGKTGTGCLVGHECMDRPDKMLGWFVGVLHNPDSDYVFAANASDLVPQGPPAGPRMRQTVVQLLEKLELAK